MLDALQKIGMRFRKNRQRWATEILKATKGEDLTRLKAYVDDGGVSHAYQHFRCLLPRPALAERTEVVNLQSLNRCSGHT